MDGNSKYLKRDRPAQSREYSRRVFRENRLSPAPDAELADLVAMSSQHLGDDDLAKFLRAQKKFDGPVQMWDTGQIVQHWGLRNSLKELPEYMLAAESAGLAYSQANELLLHFLHSEPYDFHHENVTINLMARAYRRAAQAGVSIPASYGLVKDMIALGAKEGVIDGTFYAFSILMRLGLSPDQACKMVMRLPEADGSASGYVFPYFNDAIKSMLPAKVNPDLVVETFALLGGDRPWFQLGDYKGFTDAMTFECPSQGMTPNEFLAKFVSSAKKGTTDNLLLGSGDATNADKKSAGMASLERHFTDISGELEHAAQPYRVQRSLNQGIRDLEKLAHASSHMWEEVREGGWVFDPEKNIWYSFGGQLELPGMAQVLSGTADRVRHLFVPYDLSLLSKTPFLFHIHPQALDCFVAPHREDLAYPEFRDDLTKFLTATPSRADYGVVAALLKDSQRPVSTRSFIAHALGVTEFTYPNDMAQLEDMAKKSRDIRDQVMLHFDIDDAFKRNPSPENTFDLVNALVQNLDDRLPAGFGLVLHRAGTDFEQ